MHSSVRLAEHTPWCYPKHLPLIQSASDTSPTMMGTSTKGPMTAAKAAPELIPKTAIATAIANSKLLLDAVKESVQQRLYSIPILMVRKKSVET